MEKKDQLKGLLGGATDAGGGTDPRPKDEQQEYAVLSNVKEIAGARIAALEAQAKDLDAKLAKATADLAVFAVAAHEHRVDEAIRMGRVLEADRGRLVKLAAKAPDLLDEFIGKSDAVPQGTVIATRRTEGAGLAEVDRESEEYKSFSRAFSWAPAGEKRDKLVRESMVARSKKLNGHSEVL